MWPNLKSVIGLTAVFVLPALVSCTSMDYQFAGQSAVTTTPTASTQTSALESVLAEQKKQQELFLAKQKEMLAAQQAFIEEQRQKQLAMLAGKQPKIQSQTTNALVAKPSDIAKPQVRKTTPEPKKASVGGSVRAAGNVTLNAPWKCVPTKLKAVINEVSRRYGPVIVNSTHRSRGKNRRVGGAKRSYHLNCQAVDFRVRGDGRAVLRFLANHPHVGGLKRYRSGYFHIDTGPRRTWRG